jgi:alanyl-tRNA synthetase
MTTRLYYQEPYLTTFDAFVMACDASEGRFHVMLDRTAFYPTSGGQPFDVGTLGSVRVLDVVDREDGEITHVVDAAIAVGEQVTGLIDWQRRFDHMQQHTGQHVLSAAFDRRFNARTESFHLGAVSSTIDLGREVSGAEIAAAEDEANRVVWEDRPVTISFASAEQAAALPLRKDPTRTGPLRLITVEDYDLSACGGTHVARTGAIGVIAVANAEKFRGGTRIEFLCGGRALARFRAWRDAFASTQRFLSVPPAELAASVERLQAEGKTLQRTVRAVQERLAVHEARALIAGGEARPDRVVVVQALEGWDANGLKALAAAATAVESRAVVALFSTSTPALVVLARGQAAGNVDVAAILKMLLGRFGGKGGGKPDLAQGGGLVGETQELLKAAREALGN